jgi:hypothetical protein
MLKPSNPVKPADPKPRAQRPQKSTLAKSALPGGAIAKLVLHLQAVGSLSLQLAQRHPIPLVGTFWVILLLIGLASMDSLVTAGLKGNSTASEQQLRGATLADDSENAEAVEPLSPQVMHQKSRIPLGLFGAIVLTGAGSAILLSTQLPRATPRPRQPQRHPRSAHRPVGSPPVTAPVGLRQSPPAPMRQPVKPLALGSALVAASPPLVRQPSAPGYLRPIQAARPRTNSQPATVTLPTLSVAPPIAAATPTQIVPPQDTHPLDWPEGSLVDAVDLRKQRSLASWLNQNPSPMTEG